MGLPVFYSPAISENDMSHVLDEETSKHIVQVLRMQKNESLKLTNGNGHMFLATITDNHKKAVVIEVTEVSVAVPPAKISIGISLVKNVQRFEWFLEKAVEIGISEIFPLICARTEKQQFRAPRLKGIITSAMLQSQQAWLPFLHEPQKFQQFISRSRESQCFIAHCLDEQSRSSLPQYAPFINPLMLIGPEGDFTHEEITLALNKGYLPVTLGETRLRTETAGIVAVTLLNNSLADSSL